MKALRAFSMMSPSVTGPASANWFHHTSLYGKLESSVSSELMESYLDATLNQSNRCKIKAYAIFWLQFGDRVELVWKGHLWFSWFFIPPIKSSLDGKLLSDRYQKDIRQISDRYQTDIVLFVVLTPPSLRVPSNSLKIWLKVSCNESGAFHPQNAMYDECWGCLYCFHWKFHCLLISKFWGHYLCLYFI